MNIDESANSLSNDLKWEANNSELKEQKDKRTMSQGGRGASVKNLVDLAYNETELLADFNGS